MHHVGLNFASYPQPPIMEGCIQSAVTTYIIQYMQTNNTETAQRKVDEISYGLDTNYLFEILLPWQACGSWGECCVSCRQGWEEGMILENRLVEGVCLLTNQGIIVVVFALFLCQFLFWFVSISLLFTCLVLLIFCIHYCVCQCVPVMSSCPVLKNIFCHNGHLLPIHVQRIKEGTKKKTWRKKEKKRKNKKIKK